MYVLVPVNKKGIEDYEAVQEETSDNIEWFEISEDEINSLYKHNIIQEINETCNLMIDTYESEEVPLSKVGGCLEILKAHKKDNCNMAKALKAALNYGTCAYCDF